MLCAHSGTEEPGGGTNLVGRCVFCSACRVGVAIMEMDEYLLEKDHEVCVWQILQSLECQARSRNAVMVNLSQLPQTRISPPDRPQY